MIKIPLKHPIHIGSTLWWEILRWAEENHITVRCNSTAFLFYDKDADYAITFRLKFDI